MTDTDTITVPTDSTGLAAAIEEAKVDGTTDDLWRRLTEQEEGFGDALDLWAAAVRENDRLVLAPAGGPGDRSPEGLALAVVRFVRAAGLEDDDLLRAEAHGVPSWAGDLTFHVATYARAEAIGAKFGLAEDDRSINVRDAGARRLHTFRGVWQEYEVTVFAIADQSGTEVQA